MYLEFLLPSKIKEIFKNIDEIPTIGRSESIKLKSETDRISDFCLSYDIQCAPSHYQNLFLDFDKNVEKKILLLSNAAKKLILKDKRNIADQLTKEKQSPQKYSLLLIVMICEQFLGSGSYHIYRGTLLPEGLTFALIHYLLSNYSEQKGFLSFDQKKEITNHLKKLIKNVG